MLTLSRSALLATAALIAQPAAAQTRSTSPAPARPNPVSTTSVGTGASDDAPEIIVTARHKPESSQAVPLAISVIGGDHIDNTGAFNVGRLQQLTPTLQFYSSNPRNSSVNIRGIGAPVGYSGASKGRLRGPDPRTGGEHADRARHPQCRGFIAVVWRWCGV